MNTFNKSLLAISITSLLTACGGSNNDTSSSTVPNNSNPTTPTTPTTPTAKSIKATLVNHGSDFTWEKGETISVNAVDQDNKAVTIKSCTSDDNTRLAVSEDCKALTVHRLGQSTLTVTDTNNLTTKITVNGVPARMPLAVNSSVNDLVHVITPEGKLMVWGSNSTSSRLATTTGKKPDFVQYPTQVITADGSPLSDIYQVTDSNGTSFALDLKGRVYGWGLGVSGKTVSKGVNIYFPELMLDATANQPLANIVQIATSDFAQGEAIGLTDEGKVMVWGFGLRRYPTYINDANGQPLMNIKQIAMGGSNIDDSLLTALYAIDKDGQVYAFNLDINKLPYDIRLVKDKNGQPLRGVTKVVASSFHALALTQSGNVYAWGKPKEHLGDEKLLNSTVQHINYANLVNIKGVPLTNIKDIGVNFGSSYAVTQSGNVYAWGNAPVGQLGDGANNPLGNATAIPTLVTSETGSGVLQNVIAITTANDAALALKTDGTIVGWGNNWHGLLTQTPPTSGQRYFSPVVIQANEGQPFKVDLSKYTQLN